MPKKTFFNYKVLGAIAIIIIVLALLLVSPQVQLPTITTTTIPVPTTTTTTPVTTTPAPVVTTGNLIIAVKDVKQKVSGVGTVNALTLTVDSIMVHKSGGSWITISNVTKTFDLISYTDVIGIIGEKALDAGNYTQIRLNIANATVKVDNTPSGIYNKTYTMKIPSNEIKLVNPFTVVADKTLALTLDFDVTETVSHTAEGYLLKPVIKVLEETLAKGQKPTNSVEIK